MRLFEFSMITALISIRERYSRNGFTMLHPANVLFDTIYVGRVSRMAIGKSFQNSIAKARIGTRRLCSLARRALLPETQLSIIIARHAINQDDDAACSVSVASYNRNILFGIFQVLQVFQVFKKLQIAKSASYSIRVLSI